MEKVYLDYAASTPVDSAVERAMRPYWSGKYGNPGALHWFGQQASAAIFGARSKIAKLLGCDYKEIIFTGSATEANNLALRGVIKAYKTDRSDKSDKSNRIDRPRIITSAIEHESILDTCRDLEKEGVEVVYLPVDKNGIVNLRKLKEALNERTILVSIIYANNEIGTIQPISKIAEIVRNFRNGREKRREEGEKNFSPFTFPLPLFHTDAVQGFNYLDCGVNKLGVDLMTLSSQKIYGPKGVGLLYARGIQRSKFIKPIITGGGQEYGLRSGTENVPGIVGFSGAMVVAEKLKKRECARIKILRDRLEKGIFKLIPKVELNGHPIKRLPNLLNVSILDIEGEALLLYLDKAGIYVSTGSACSSRTLKPSHVLVALGKSHKYIHGTIRFSLGRGTTASAVNYTLKALPEIVKKLRKISSTTLNICYGKK